MAQSLADLKNEIEERRSASRQRGLYLSLARLTELFLLNRFEEECLVVCLAPEVDRKYEKLYAYLQDDATRKKPGVDLLLNLLCKTLPQRLAARAALDPSAPLFKFKLLQLTDNSAEGQPPLRARTLKLDDRIVNFLLGHRQLDARLERFARIVVPQADAANTMVAQEFYQRADRFLHAYFKEQQSAGRNVLLYLQGPVNSDQRSAVEAICRSYDLPLLVADVEAIKASPLPFDHATATPAGRNCRRLVLPMRRHLRIPPSLFWAALRARPPASAQSTPRLERRLGWWWPAICRSIA